MSSLHKALLLTLIVSTGASASNRSTHSNTRVMSSGVAITSEDIKAAMHKAGESLKAGANSTLDAIKGLDNVTFADVRKAAIANCQKAKNSLEALPAAFEQSANNALDYIKANKTETAMQAAIVAYAAVFAYAFYDFYRDCQKEKERQAYNAQPYYAVGNGGTTTTVYYE